MLLRSLVSGQRQLAHSRRLGNQFLRQAPVRSRQMNWRSFSSIKITFVDGDGEKETVDAKIGDSMIDVAHENDIEVEAACGGEMACSTCHMIFDEATYDRLLKESPPEEEEEDMLDLALGLTETSRLGCQIIAKDWMDGITIKLPAETANMQG